MDAQGQNQNNIGEKSPEIVKALQIIKQNIKPQIVIAIVVAVVLIGAFVWWYVDNQKLAGITPVNNNPTETSNLQNYVDNQKLAGITPAGITPVNNNPTETSNLQNNEFNVPMLKFTDGELGITFDYPESWGNTIISVKADSWSLTKKISFTNQPNLYFEIVSPALRSDAQNLQIPSGFTTDLSRYCKQNILGDRSEPLSDVYDLYRMSGSDEFGTCPNDQGNISAIIYRTDKSVDPGTSSKNVVVPKKDLDKGSGMTTLKFSKRYYLKIKNSLYDPIIVYQNGIPDVKSRNYCYSTFSTHWRADPRYLKTYKCISYNDKPLIEKAFSEFAGFEFNKQTELVLKGMKISSVENAGQYFSNHFADLVKYEDAKYSYLYPKILVPDRLDRDTKFNAVKIVTRQSVVQEELENCEELCFAPTLTSAGWDNEKKLLESNQPDGNVGCVQGINGDSLCEVKTLGKNKFLIRYTGRFGGDSVVEKTYIIYKGPIRYEITPPELGSQGTDPALFKGIENQFIQKIYENIVKSLILL